MVCDPASNNINIPIPGPGPSLPGLGLPFSIPKLPFPDVKIPPGIPEDIIALIDRIFALLPQGIKFIPNADAFMKGIWDALASIFNQIAPFLGFYKFIQALLNIILCIIDVLCALLNPWATKKALKRLFTQCIPDFLSLFPWLALLIMILALILLLIALIKYIIELITSYIQQIIKNIEVLSDAIRVHDEDAILAAVNKLSYLICMIEQLFAILMAIAALIAIIKPLMYVFGRSVCKRGDSCCTDDFCPPFAANGANGYPSASGRLIYHSRVETLKPTDPLFSFLNNVELPPLREERWQFVDDNPGDFKFLDIITPSQEYGFTYWPEGEQYDSAANVMYVPYLLDMNLELNPADFGNPSDTDGYRAFIIRDIIVCKRPTEYPVSWNNGTEITNPVSGNLFMLAGKVYEADGSTPYMINGVQATLETLVSKDPLISYQIPLTDDGYNFIGVSYTFRLNYPILFDKKLITSMCNPELAAESEVLNAEFNDTRSVFEKVGDLPDIGSLNTDRTDGTGALGCLARSLTKFRKNINTESANVLQTETTECLNSLLAESEAFYCNGVKAAADRFKSDMELSPDVQWINLDIDVIVRLRDKSGAQLGLGVEQSLGDCIKDLISANVTLGEISEFEYDGYGEFRARISSEEAGSGELTIYLANEPLAEVINRDNEEVTSEIITRTLDYEFIDRSLSYRREFGDDEKVRFGPSDISEDGV